MTAPTDTTTDVVEGPYDSKQRYQTVTSINHGYVDETSGEAKSLVVPPDADFSKYADDFTDDEKNAFVLQGTIAPLSDVNADIADSNDALVKENQTLEADKADLQKQVDELNAKLAAAQGNK